MFNYEQFIRQYYQIGPQRIPEGTTSTIPSQETLNAQREHSELLEKINKLKAKLREYKKENKQLKDYINELEDLFKPEGKRKKIKRRTENQLEKDYGCPYDRCKKEYASSLALNLHIRNKHNGGTKKQRVAYVKEFIEAKEKGNEFLPPTTLNMPPEVIEYEIQLFKDRQESENMSKENKNQYDKPKVKMLSRSPSIQQQISS